MRSITKLFVVLIFLALSTSLFAQASASATADVLAQLKKGLTLSNLDGDLDFGEIIVLTTPQTPVITPANGVRFLASGHPNKNVTVTFSGVTLNGSGGGTIAFTPDVDHTGNSSTYSLPVDVTSGGSYQLVNTTGTGQLYLWLGGSLAIAANQLEGDYTGTFTLTVAY
ncbi:MAG: DUF4402 domain-containing protein [Ignavibacteriaceae bacterium]|nr:DUF4402 domain-containing protein [Ignavibacteriaceae bacterium]